VDAIFHPRISVENRKLMMRVLAFDIGGANLKGADGRGAAVSRPFPLWKTPEKLEAALGELAAELPAADRWGITMTGELADCFRTKAEGVKRIVQAAANAAAGRETLAYGVDGRWRSVEEAVAAPLAVAASNWHALAAFAARFVAERPSLLIDVGSTTCDIIPLRAGRPAALGLSDPARLASGELVYTGVVRSPVCALVSSLDLRGVTYGVAQELFATTWDVYLTLGDLPEQPNETSTADGRPATREFARERLARSICADASTFSAEDALEAARQIAAAQRRLLSLAAARVVGRQPEAPCAVVISGQGEFLARAVWAESNVAPHAEVVSLGNVLGPVVTRCAPAHALAVLLAERG
jgi:probable H4MPT-linked C1 transfer pathway protein